MEKLLEAGDSSDGRLSKPCGKYDLLVYYSSPKTEALPESNPSSPCSSSRIDDFSSCNAVNSNDLHVGQVNTEEKPTIATKSIECVTTIIFDDEDLLLGSIPYNHPLFMTSYIRGQKVNKILIDGGSAVNILPL